ncbi:MAG: PHP domain-containing protein [Candidatus Humimicrobiia bacterium]
MIKPYVADLHIHTVLSPCAEIEMIPKLIINKALSKKIDILAITDHNSAENVKAVIEAANGTKVKIFPGVEVETKEEVHIICIFDELKEALELQKIIYRNLPNLKNKEKIFGSQLVVNSKGEFIRKNERLLLTATSLSIEDIVKKVKELDGICYPAHIDRSSYSIISNLGFIPPQLNFLAVEISLNADIYDILQKYKNLKNYTIISSGDAHRLSELSDRTIFWIEKQTLNELKLAFLNKNGRRVSLKEKQKGEN